MNSMKRQSHHVSFGALCAAALLTLTVHPTLAGAPKKPLKVFVLAGQSNMEGHAKVTAFDHLALDPQTVPILEKMRADDGAPRVCEDAWIAYFNGSDSGGDDAHGKLTAGYGSRRDISQDGGKIGPEFTFGIYMQQFLDEPILLIKTAWGGKALHTDFRPPSAGLYVFNESQLESMAKRGQDLEKIKADKATATGRYYRLMTAYVQRVLQDIKRVYPAYDAQQGYELAGFVWFQGWNDMVDRGTYPKRDQPGGYAQYSECLAHFIRDVRRDLSAPEMHVVIGVMGAEGPVNESTPERYRGLRQGFRDAMAAPASLPEFKGNVTAVLTEQYWDPELDAVAKKLDQVRGKARALRKANEGYPDKEGTISPKAQQEIVEQFRAELLTPRDLEVQKGITNAAYHYLGSPKIMAQIGKGFAEAMRAGLAAP